MNRRTWLFDGVLGFLCSATGIGTYKLLDKLFSPKAPVTPKQSFDLGGQLAQEHGLVDGQLSYSQRVDVLYDSYSEQKSYLGTDDVACLIRWQPHGKSATVREFRLRNPADREAAKQLAADLQRQYPGWLPADILADIVENYPKPPMVYSADQLTLAVERLP